MSPSTDSTDWVGRWFDDNLVCPYDGSSLAAAEQRRVCPAGHDFPVVHGVPVVLRHDVPPTHHLWRTTADDVARQAARPLFDVAAGDSAIDPFVERWLVATCGLLYRRYRRPLARYPIPEIGLPPGEGRALLDVGSNWGRWALAAARAGYRVVAIDPSLEATLAGRRIARQLELPVAYVVGDARHLPFRSDAFDVCFSYSVLQHLDKGVVGEVLREIARTSRGGATIRIQMANLLGLRQLLNQSVTHIRSGARALVGRRRAPYPFRVRAWTPGELLRTFADLLGPTTLSADGFFSLNAQRSDADLLRPFAATVIRVSDLLCRVAAKVPDLAFLADSVWLDAIKSNEPLASRSA